MKKCPKCKRYDKAVFSKLGYNNIEWKCECGRCMCLNHPDRKALNDLSLCEECYTKYKEE